MANFGIFTVLILLWVLSAPPPPTTLNSSEQEGSVGGVWGLVEANGQDEHMAFQIQTLGPAGMRMDKKSTGSALFPAAAQ